MPGTRNLTESVVFTTSVISWPCPPETLRLESEQIHVWCAALSDFDCELPRFEALISSAERAKAERFRFSKDRNHYIIRHGILRLILGRYLKRHPSAIDFCYGPFGKPEIQHDAARNRLNFNASHSGDLAIYAVTRAFSIGVDVEYLRPVPNFEEIASQFFSPREAATLLAVPTESRIERFFAYWTGKESFLKATGEGIGGGLAKVEVTLTPGEEAEILSIAGQLPTRTEWKVRSFSPARGYLAAIALAPSRPT
jgi:4'-phosphopantetheinyl transferase